MIVNKQTEALKKVKTLLNNSNLNNPHLTSSIWSTINGGNNQMSITEEESKEFSENWNQDLVGELQRTLVDYQLHQLKLGKAPSVFKPIKATFDQISEDGLSLLDVGCTSGYYYEVIDFYHPNKFEYRGCDYNSESINLARSYYPNIDFRVEDVTKLNYLDQECDITLLSGVIEHVPDYRRAIKELCRVSKKYIVLHRIRLTGGVTYCKKGTQYFVPIVRNTYNKNEFFKLFESRSFNVVYEGASFDSGYRTYILEKGA
jgi:SAM-dependent methyltransferase